MKTIFVNSEGEVRAVWKIAVVFVIYILFTIIFGTVAAVLLQQHVIREASFYWVLLYLGPLVTIASVYCTLKIVDRKKLRDIGFADRHHGFGDFGYGFLLGAAAMTLIFLVLYATGQISLEKGLLHPTISLAFLQGLLFYSLVAVSEELLFRGYLVTALLQTKSIKIAVIGSSAFFSIAHSLNPHVTVVGLTNIFLVGVLFAVMFLKTGSLWMPIGYHLSWNFFQGSVFGFPVSGTTANGVYEVSEFQEGWLSGGAFGPEGGILTTIATALVLIVVWRSPGRTVP